VDEVGGQRSKDTARCGVGKWSERLVVGRGFSVHTHTQCMKACVRVTKRICHDGIYGLL